MTKKQMHIWVKSHLTDKAMGTRLRRRSTLQLLSPVVLALAFGACSDKHDLQDTTADAGADAAAAENQSSGASDVHMDTSADEGSYDTVAAVSGEGCGAIDLPPPAQDEGVQVALEIDLEPGQERQVCKLVKLDNPINLSSSRGAFTLGSHHGLLQATAYHGEYPTENLRGEPVEDPEAVIECLTPGDIWDTQAVVAIGSPVGHPSKLGAAGVLPRDVATKLGAGDVFVMNFHMLNFTDKPMKACYKQNLYGIPDEQVKAEAGTMFYYNPFITVPANGRSSTTMACPVTEDVMLAAQVSHMHSRGVGYRARLLDGDPLAGGRELQSLYEGDEWDEPAVQVNSPAIQLHAGQWIEWTCEYDNPEPRNIAQGQQTTDEMCMFIGTYWPRSARMDGCVMSDEEEAPSARRFLGNGEKNAVEMLTCLQQSPRVFTGGGAEDSAERYESQICLTESCPRASGYLRELTSGEMSPEDVSCD